MLAAARRAGVRIPFGCRGGGCGRCKIFVELGEVAMGRYSKSALTDEEREQGFYLACQAVPLSALTIAYTYVMGLKEGVHWWVEPVAASGKTCTSGNRR